MKTYRGQFRVATLAGRTISFACVGGSEHTKLCAHTDKKGNRVEKYLLRAIRAFEQGCMLDWETATIALRYTDEDYLANGIEPVEFRLWLLSQAK